MTEPDVPDMLRSLIAAERAAPIADLASPAVVRAKLAATVGAAPLGAASAAGSALLAAKVIVGIALAIGIGAVALRSRTNDARTSSDSAIVDRPSVTANVGEPSHPAQPPPQPVPSTPSVVVVTASPPANGSTSDARIPRRTRAAKTVATSASSTPSQTELLREAWSAMGSGDAHRALALTRRDEHLHPHGALAEERDVLRVEALQRLRRFDDARLARDRFLARYPSSIHRARIRAIDAEETP